MHSSHIWPSKPSPLLALICLVIVHRLRPEWVAIPIRQAARGEGYNAERISRLATKALGLFESSIGQLTRLGRPRKGQADDESELALTQALLEVATSILQQVALRKPAMRALVVGAYLRLREAHPRITQKHFCQALAVPVRTLRSWLEKQPVSDVRSSPIEKTNPAPKRPPRQRRKRFGFALTVPDTQIAADTTDLRAFGVPLKLVATQDVGGRDQDLLDAVLVDDRESAEHVVAVLTESLTARPGAQLLTDQGTPYLAAQTREAIDALEVEHAVQKEGDPLGKATIERAFGTVKSIASPLLELTNRAAGTIGCLAQPELAIAATTLLLTALLRAYQAGARASHRAQAERPADIEQLARAAEQSRERARADDRSARLLLEHIHGAYDIDCPIRDFVRRFRRFPVPALRAAERAFAKQAHRSDINNRAAYFAAIARAALDAHRNQQARDRRNREEIERLERHRSNVEAERKAWHADPASWLRDTLDLLAQQWTGTSLLCDGAGVSTWLRQSLTRLAELYGPRAADIVTCVFRNFTQTQLPNIRPAGITAVATVLQRHLDALPTPSCEPSQAAHFAAIVLGTGSNPRPPPSPNPC